MGRRYIKQIINRDFVYPNFEKDEYDDEIIHELNENLVSGSVVTFSATTVSTSSITIQYSFNWDANGAELFQMEDGNYSYVSIHLMDASQVYMRPYRVIHNIESATEYTGTTSFTGSTTVTPSQLGLSQFTTGVYYYEVRFIGQRAVYVISSSFTVVQVTPTPTPSPTVTASPTPTPTLTPSPTPSGAVGDFTLSPQYGLDMTALSVSGGQSLPAFTFPTTGTTQQILTMVQGYTAGTSFTITLNGTRTPSQTLSVSLIKNSIDILDCEDILSDPSSQNFTLTSAGSISINDNLRISIGSSAC